MAYSRIRPDILHWNSLPFEKTGHMKISECTKLAIFHVFLAKMSKIMALHLKKSKNCKSMLVLLLHRNSHKLELLLKILLLLLRPFFKCKANFFWRFGQKKREKWPIWVPFFACQLENTPSPSSNNAIHLEIFIWLVLKKGQCRISGRILE